MADIQFQCIFKAYGQHASVIRDVNLHIAQGEFCVFVGPSGCGKSTLLRMVAGLEDISAGQLHIGGTLMNDVPSAKRGVAMVFQSYALFPHMTVFENMAFGMRLAKEKPDVIKQKVHDAAAILQLEPYLDRLPKALSGGQRQRVAIGRAIVRAPGVFLFDEPLSNLDAALRAQTRYEIAKIHRDFGNASTIYVTHDQVEAMTLADRILLLNSGAAVEKEGSVAQCGTPLELYHYPRNLFVAGFIGSPKMNFMPARLISSTPSQATIELAQGERLTVDVDAQRLQTGAAVTLGIRPEHAQLGAQSQHIVREVQWQERLGDSTYLYLKSGCADQASSMQPLVVKADGLAIAQAGQRIALALPSTQGHLFDAQGIALPRRIDARDMPISNVVA